MQRARLHIDDIESVKAKLLSNRVIDSNGCWLWLGGISNGYGEIAIEGITYTVHRLSLYVFSNLSLKDSSIQALHKDICHKKICFNPDHLYIGTQADNMKDRSKRVAANLTFERCGHLRTPENTYKSGVAGRCAQCNKEYQEKHPKNQFSVQGERNDALNAANC